MTGRAPPGPRRWVAVALAPWLALPAPLECAAWAQTPAVAPTPLSAPLKTRADQLVGLFNGTRKGELFTPYFLSQIPFSQIAEIARQLTVQYGQARSVVKIEPRTATAGTIYVDFERAIVRVEIVVEEASPSRISGLVVAMADRKGDTPAAVVRELWVLPGETSLAIANLSDDGPPAFTLAQNADRPLPVASAFKLVLLAEVGRAVKAGERKWTDVVPLDRRSVPSGFLQSWPQNAPMTLYALTALMISQSDNSATDTLLHLIGRERLEQLLPTLGVRAPERLRPLLETREVALLQASGDADLARQWEQGNEQQRRALLVGALADVPPERVDLSRLTAGPHLAPDAEWFLSTGDLVRILDWIRRHADKQALDILAINKGLPRTTAADFAYLGYKGGSDAGVINMTFLVGDKQGGWHAVSGTWTNPKAPVDETRFLVLMSRAVALLR